MELMKCEKVQTCLLRTTMPCSRKKICPKSCGRSSSRNQWFLLVLLLVSLTATSWQLFVTYHSGWRTKVGVNTTNDTVSFSQPHSVLEKIPTENSEHLPKTQHPAIFIDIRTQQFTDVDIAIAQSASGSNLPKTGNRSKNSTRKKYADTIVTSSRSAIERSLTTVNSTNTSTRTKYADRTITSARNAVGRSLTKMVNSTNISTRTKYAERTINTAHYDSELNGTKTLHSTYDRSNNSALNIQNTTGSNWTRTVKSAYNATRAKYAEKITKTADSGTRSNRTKTVNSVYYTTRTKYTDTITKTAESATGRNRTKSVNRTNHTDRTNNYADSVFDTAHNVSGHSRTKTINTFYNANMTEFASGIINTADPHAGTGRSRTIAVISGKTGIRSKYPSRAILNASTIAVNRTMAYKKRKDESRKFKVVRDARIVANVVDDGFRRNVIRDASGSLLCSEKPSHVRKL